MMAEEVAPEKLPPAAMLAVMLSEPVFRLLDESTALPLLGVAVPREVLPL
jgi:hypothetical protein